VPLHQGFSAPPAPPHPALSAEAIVRCLRPHLRPRRRQRIERVLSQRLASVTVVLERPYDPHNGAAMLRSAEALGLLHVHVIQGDDGFSFSRKVTVSAHKWLDVHLHDSTAACLEGLSGAGFQLWAALPPQVGRPGELSRSSRAPCSSVAGVDVDASRPIALVFGNEHAGLGAEALALCPRRFHVPMFGFSESFNLSVSVALALAPVVAARRRVLGRAGDLPPSALSRLRAAYLARSTRHAVRLLQHGIAQHDR